jgi:hypothetical protein
MLLLHIMSVLQDDDRRAPISPLTPPKLPRQAPDAHSTSSCRANRNPDHDQIRENGVRPEAWYGQVLDVYTHCFANENSSAVLDGRSDVVRLADRPRAMAHHHRSLPNATSNKATFAEAPPVQTQAIDDVYRTVASSDDDEKTAEGKKILAELAQLKYEVQHDRALTCVPSGLSP